MRTFHKTCLHQPQSPLKTYPLRPLYRLERIRSCCSHDLCGMDENPFLSNLVLPPGIICPADFANDVSQLFQG